MALLRPRFLRVATYTTVLALSLHFTTLLLLPASSHVAGFIQTSIAAIALGALIGIVLADYRRGGRLMKAVEEDVLIIAVVALFWLSFATVLRVFGKPPSTNTVHHIIRGPLGVGSSAQQQQNGQQQQQQPGQRLYQGDLHQQPLYHHPGHAHTHQASQPNANADTNTNANANTDTNANTNANANANTNGGAAQPQPNAQTNAHTHAHAHTHHHAYQRAQSYNPYYYNHHLFHHRHAHKHAYQQPPPPPQQQQAAQQQQQYQYQYQYQQPPQQQQQQQQQQHQQPAATPASSDSEATPTLTLRYYSTQTPLSLRDRLRGTTRSYVVVEDWMDNHRRRR